MYVCKIIKSSTSTDEEFLSAVACAASCIGSRFEDEGWSVISNNDKIFISSGDVGESTNISLEELKREVKGCFCDSKMRAYSEFGRIIITSEVVR